MSAYYNEFDAFAAQWLRNLIAKGLIANGEVDQRTIVDVRADDLRPFRQCHFFAGIGGWSLALRLAGWEDERPAWTGSCPCQPLSVAGQRKGHADERHLWPAFYGLIAERRTPTVFGEQVASKDGREWFAGVRADLEGAGYACGAANLPACGVGAPHRRERLFWVADAGCHGRGEYAQRDGDQEESRQCSPCGRDVAGRSDLGLADAAHERRERVGHSRQRGHGSPNDNATTFVADAESLGRRRRPDREDEGRRQRAFADSGERGLVDAEGERRRERWAEPEFRGGWDPAPRASLRPWDDAEWRTGADGKARRVGAGLRLLAHGVPGRLGRIRGYGNAIVPQVAAEFVAAFMECQP